MKISFYISNLEGGGAERVFINLINYVHDQRHEVDILLNSAEGLNIKSLNPGIRINILNSDVSKRSVGEIKVFIESSSPDVFISTLSHCNYALIIANLFSKRKTKVIVREASSFLSQRKSLSRIRQLYEILRASILYRNANKIIVNSEGSKHELIKATYLNPDKIFILNNPVDEKYILKQSRKLLNHHLKSFFNDSIIILGVGRLERSKDFATLIEAFSKVRIENCKLLIIGEGSLRFELEGLIKKMDLGNRVLLPGYVENPYNIIANSGVFILSSLHEGMPNALIEALILGVPVVSTDCPNGPRELLKDGKYGMLVNPADPLEMANAIEYQLSEDRIIPIKKEFERYFMSNVGNQFMELIYKVIENA